MSENRPSDVVLKAMQFQNQHENLTNVEFLNSLFPWFLYYVYGLSNLSEFKSK